VRLEAALQNFRSRIAPLERFIELWAASLAEPQFVSYGSDRGFRYQAPDVRHFCLLKSVRVVSALNASFVLARYGYTQEIAVLVRTLVECTTHIEYVLDPSNSEAHRSEVKKFVEDFFADAQRDPGTEVKKAQIPQGKVHTRIGATLDDIAANYRETEGRRPAAELFSHIYRVFSNYVHSKYPEIMDLYGDRPGRFHLRGMEGTPKDHENVEVIQASIESASNTFVIVVRNLELGALVESDPILAAWYRGRLER